MVKELGEYKHKLKSQMRNSTEKSKINIYKNLFKNFI